MPTALTLSGSGLTRWPRAPGSVSASFSQPAPGGGWVINQQVLKGRNAIGGEWGHKSAALATAAELPWYSMVFCGKRGCIENLRLRVPAFARESPTADWRDIVALEITQRAERQRTPRLRWPTLARLLNDGLARALASVDQRGWIQTISGAGWRYVPPLNQPL